MDGFDGSDQRPDVEAQPTCGSKQAILFPEIVHMVVVYLSDDKQSLRSASLLGREWIYPSQRLLFRSISLKCDAQSSSLDKFSEGIDTRTHVVALVHDLTLQPQCNRGGKVSLPSLLQVVQRLPSLDTLTLQGPELVLYEGIAAPVPASWHPTTRSVSKLSLFHINGPVDAFDLLFFSLPVRDSIHLEGISAYCKPHSSGPPPSLPNSLHSGSCDATSLVIDTKHTRTHLAFGNFVGLQFYQPFFHSLRNLHSLSVGPLFWDTDCVLFHYSQGLLQERGSGIRHLRLDITASGRNRPSTNWNLSEFCPTLQSLTVVIFYHLDYDGDGNENLAGVPDIVSLLSRSPSTLQTFTLEIQSPGNFLLARDENVVDLTAVDNALSRLHHLEVVRIQGTILNPRTRKPQELPPGLPPFLSKRLPATESSGILQFGENVN